VASARQSERDRRNERLLLNDVNRLKFERDSLIEVDAKKNKVIERLEMRVK